MQKGIIIILTCLFLVNCLSLPAQSIRRSVISSMGSSQISGENIHIRSTIAQPPNAGTINNGEIYLRQGFQQPGGCLQAPDAAFDYQNTGDGNCASPILFSYLGTPSETTTFLWEFGEGASVLSSDLQQPPEILYLTPGNKMVRLTVTTGNCTNTQSISLEIEQTPIHIDIQSQDLICLEDQDGAILLEVEGGISPYDISWNTGQSGEHISGLVPGTYSFELTDANNCIIRDTIKVNGPDSLLLNATTTNESCDGLTDGAIVLEVRGGSPPYAYAWSNNSADPNQIGLNAGNYAVTVTDDNKCEQNLSISLENNCGTLGIYDVFTPNGDGQNDVWFIDGIENFPENELQIFDRWGRLVFNTKAYTGDWDGRANDGTQLPMAAYFYILQLNDLNDTIHKGAVTILR